MDVYLDITMMPPLLYARIALVTVLLVLVQRLALHVYLDIVLAMTLPNVLRSTPPSRTVRAMAQMAVETRFVRSVPNHMV